MNHYCRPRSRWHRLLHALRLRRRRTACSCHLVSDRPVIVTGSGEEEDPYVVKL